MANSTGLGILREALWQLIQRIAEYLPNLLASLGLILVGWVLARFLRNGISRLVITGLERLSRNSTIQQALDRTGTRTAIPKIVSGITFWVVLLVFVAAAIENLGLLALTSIVDRLASYLPHVLAGVLIVILGFLGGNLAHGAVSAAADSMGSRYGSLLGRAVQLTILTTAILLGVQQIGIDTSFLLVMMTILIAATLGGIALGFGLGSGTAVSNIIASYYVLKSYRIGQIVRIGDVKGRILEFTPTSVILDTPDGHVMIPAKKFSEEISIVVTEGD